MHVLDRRPGVGCMCMWAWVGDHLCRQHATREACQAVTVAMPTVTPPAFDLCGTGMRGLLTVRSPSPGCVSTTPCCGMTARHTASGARHGRVSSCTGGRSSACGVDGMSRCCCRARGRSSTVQLAPTIPLSSGRRCICPARCAARADLRSLRSSRLTKLSGRRTQPTGLPASVMQRVLAERGVNVVPTAGWPTAG